jgi:hypothetical protein
MPEDGRRWTSRSWRDDGTPPEEAPPCCPRGHPWGPNRVLVGWLPYLCQGERGHRLYLCRACDAVIYRQYTVNLLSAEAHGPGQCRITGGISRHQGMRMPRCHGLLDLQPRTRWCSAAGAARLDRSGSADGCPVCRATGNGDRDRSQVPVLELVPAPAAHECVAEVVQRTAPHQESRTEGSAPGLVDTRRTWVGTGLMGAALGCHPLVRSGGRTRCWRW